MIHDRLLRLIFIPLLGILLPYISNVYTPSKYTLRENIIANLYFIFISYLVWNGSNWIHIKVRPLLKDSQTPVIRIFEIAILSAAYSVSIALLLTALWHAVSLDKFNWDFTLQFALGVILTVVIFTFVYEILFLAKERELDNRVVTELDKERIFAETHILRNELDPHFLTNSLSTLSYLVRTNTEQATSFIEKLGQVYTYFLKNKKNDWVSLYEETTFLNDYLYLINIRYGNKVQINIKYAAEVSKDWHVLPTALQTIVENAIKHNKFSEYDPLHINMTIKYNFVIITNEFRPKNINEVSTGIGLPNLNTRYKLLSNRQIKVIKTEKEFSVYLPLIKKQSYEINHKFSS